MIWQSVQNATHESIYNPTVFIIYDNSMPNHCNRLINVKPFDWWILACNDELYILNPEGGIQCPNTTSPAVRILDNQYIETCMNVSFDSIKRVYERFEPIIVIYTIPTDSNKFTVLSALNLLVKEYITFNVNVTNEKRVSHLLDGVFTTRTHYDHLTGRELDVTVLEALTSSPTIESSLIEPYKKHVQITQPSLNLQNDNIFIQER